MITKNYLKKLNKVRLLFADYCPRIYYSKNYHANIEVALAECDEETLDDFMAFEKYCKTKGLGNLISQTFQHDIGGLMSSDKHFVPRVAGFRTD